MKEWRGVLFFIICVVGLPTSVCEAQSSGKPGEPATEFAVEDMLERSRWASGVEQALLSAYPSIYPYGLWPKFNLEAIQFIAPNRALIRFEGQHDYNFVIIEGVRQTQEGELRFTVVKIFEPIPKLLPADTVHPSLMRGYRRPPTKGPIRLSQEEWEQIRVQYGDPAFTHKNYTWRFQKFEEVPENVLTMP